MKRFRLLATLFATIASAVLVADAQRSQSVDRFLGTWVGNLKLNRQASSVYPPVERTFTISRADNVLTTKRGEGPHSTLTYRLDGSSTEVEWNKRPQQTTLTWNGDQLVLDVRYPKDPKLFETQVLSIEGGLLVIEGTLGLLPSGKVLGPAKLYFDRGGSGWATLPVAGPVR